MTASQGCILPPKAAHREGSLSTTERLRGWDLNHTGTVLASPEHPGSHHFQEPRGPSPGHGWSSQGPGLEGWPSCRTEPGICPRGARAERSDCYGIREGHGAHGASWQDTRWLRALARVGAPRHHWCGRCVLCCVWKMPRKSKTPLLKFKNLVLLLWKNGGQQKRKDGNVVVPMYLPNTSSWNPTLWRPLLGPPGLSWGSGCRVGWRGRRLRVHCYFTILRTGRFTVDPTKWINKHTFRTQFIFHMKENVPDRSKSYLPRKSHPLSQDTVITLKPVDVLMY